MNQQILRRTIRKIITESWTKKYTDKIGDYAFAPQNPFLEPEQRQEQNTEIEDQIWLAIQKRVMDAFTGPDFTREMCDYLQAMIDSGKYSSVRGPYSSGIETLYRGTYLTSEHLAYRMEDGRYLFEHLAEAEPGDEIDTSECSITFREGLFDREDIVASWTNDLNVAKRFSAMNRVKPDESGAPGSMWMGPDWMFNLILVTDAVEDNEFLDLSPFYQFDPTLDVNNSREQLTSKSWEKEFLSLAEIPITSVILLKKDSSGSIKMSM